jgi:hypothetical protein
MTLVWAKERKMWRTEREAFSIEGCWLFKRSKEYYTWSRTQEVILK